MRSCGPFLMWGLAALRFKIPSHFLCWIFFLVCPDVSKQLHTLLLVASRHLSWGAFPMVRTVSPQTLSHMASLLVASYQILDHSDDINN